MPECPGTTREACAFGAKALGATIDTMTPHADMPALRAETVGMPTGRSGVAWAVNGAPIQFRK